jgi:hypothetical protein
LSPQTIASIATAEEAFIRHGDSDVMVSVMGADMTAIPQKISIGF